MTRPGNPDAVTQSETAPSGPATPAAPVAELKSKPQSMREFERSMRGLGYSQREAKAIALHGFRGLDNTVEGEVHTQLGDLVQALERNIQLLKDTPS